MTKWLARKPSSSDHRTLLSKPLIFFFPSSSPPLLVFPTLIYIMWIFYKSANKIELNWIEMPNKCPGGWARLELTEPLNRVQALAFLSTTKFSINGGWLNKRKLLSNSRRRNFSFLTTSTPSTAATTSAEKSHAFAKSRYSHRQLHRLMFFFRC